jgi:CoA:oxalate CoA-transferase
MDRQIVPAPLAGLRVIDASRVLAGPFCATLLADLGAEVVKVEPPRGDDSRAFGPFVDGDSAYFRLVNRNKYGVTLDLKAERDRATFQQLIENADVLIENFRPGALERLGLSAQTLLAWNPEIIVVSISGFGQTGPMSERPAYDMTVQALTGVMDVTGQPDGPPTRCGLSIGDIVPALYATVATLAALRRRDSGHGGAHVDIAMFDSLISLLESVGMRALHTDQVVTRFGNEHALSAPFGTFRAADGLIAVAVANDAIFRRLAQALGQNDWPEDPRFSTEAARSDHRQELNASLEARFADMSRDEILELLDRADVPSAPVQTVREALTSTQATARGLIAVEQDGFRTIRNPIRISDFEPEVPRPAPGLGADNARVEHLFAGQIDV